jgi:hypothetical protein
MSDDHRFACAPNADLRMARIGDTVPELVERRIAANHPKFEVNSLGGVVNVH